MTILLIEDDHRLADLIKLKLAPDNVLIAGSLKEARNILSTIRPTLMLVDLNLPDSRGLDTLTALKGYSVPKIVISAHCKEETCRAASLGALDYIRKTASIDEIVARIQFNLAKYRPRQRFSLDVLKEVKAHFGVELAAAH